MMTISIELANQIPRTQLPVCPQIFVLEHYLNHIIATSLRSQKYDYQKGINGGKNMRRASMVNRADPTDEA